MKKSCDNCPCLEMNKGKPFCFWYQGYILDKNGCNKNFTTKPVMTELEFEASEAKRDRFDQLLEELVSDVKLDTCRIQPLKKEITLKEK